MRVYQFRHVGTDAAVTHYILLLEYLLQNNLLQQFCYYSGLKSFAPDELSLHTAHQPCTAFLQLHSREGLSLQETEIIEQYLPKSNALRSFSAFFHRRGTCSVSATLSVRQTKASSGTLPDITVSILTVMSSVFVFRLITVNNNYRNTFEPKYPHHPQPGGHSRHIPQRQRASRPAVSRENAASACRFHGCPGPSPEGDGARRPAQV